MDFGDRLRVALRGRWDRVDATLVDTRFVEFKTYGGGPSPTTYKVNEYMVDVPGPGGLPVRLTFEEKALKVRGEPEPGDVVPVLVNAKRTKAMFDLSDPRIDGLGWQEERAREQAARDEARFEARRAGREPPPGDEDELPV